MIRVDFEKHPVWQSIAAIESGLEGISDHAKSDPYYTDLLKKTAYLRWVLEQSEPFLISTTEVDQVHQLALQIPRHFPNIEVSWTHYPQLEGNFTKSFQIFPYPRIQKIFKSDANAFFETCEARVKTLKFDTDTRLRELTEEVEELGDLLSRNARRAEEVKEALNSSEVVIAGQLESWEARLDGQISGKLTEISEDFSVDENTRRKAHGDMLDEIAVSLRKAQSNTDTTLAVNEKQIQTAKDDLKKALDDAFDDASKILQKLKALYGIAGDTTLAGDFINSAKGEGRAYFIFTTIASLFYIAIPASFAYLWVNHIDAAEFRFTDLLARLPISVVFLAPAIYFGNLAQRHRRVSVSFRSLGIRIAAFDAYLASFNANERNAEKQKMTEVFFDAKISSDAKQDMDVKSVGKALEHLTVPIGKVAEVLGQKAT